MLANGKHFMKYGGGGGGLMLPTHDNAGQGETLDE